MAEQYKQTNLFSDTDVTIKSHQHIEEQQQRKVEVKSNINNTYDIRYSVCSMCKYYNECDRDNVKRNKYRQCLEYRHILAPDIKHKY